jgi:hypothetical protein
MIRLHYLRVLILDIILGQARTEQFKDKNHSHENGI